jgi:DNA-binding beta-propeller fold protein YncE
LFIDGDTLWIALREGHSIWRMNLADGILRHVAGTGQARFTGDGGPAIKAALNGPKGVAVSADGSVIVVDAENNAIRRIDVRTGVISSLVGGSDVEKGKQPGRDAATNAKLNQPHGVCVARDGTVFVGDTLNHVVRRIRWAENGAQ